MDLAIESLEKFGVDTVGVIVLADNPPEKRKPKDGKSMPHRRNMLVTERKVSRLTTFAGAIVRTGGDRASEEPSKSLTAA